MGSLESVITEIQDFISAHTRKHQCVCAKVAKQTVRLGKSTQLSLFSFCHCST